MSFVFNNWNKPREYYYNSNDKYYELNILHDMTSHKAVYSNNIVIIILMN